MEINATLIVQLAVFLTLMLWLSRVLFAPLLRLFEERENRIMGARDEAKLIESSGLDKIALVEEKMKLAQKESRELLSKLKSDSVSYHRDVVEKAKLSSRETLSAAKNRISTELEKARSEMLPYVEENAELLAKKFLSEDSLTARKSGSSKMEFRGA